MAGKPMFGGTLPEAMNAGGGVHSASLLFEERELAGNTRQDRSLLRSPGLLHGVFLVHFLPVDRDVFRNGPANSCSWIGRFSDISRP